MSEVVYPNRAAMLRARLLNQARPPNQKVTIDGEDFFVRCPSIEDRQRVLTLAGVKKKKKKNDDDEEEIGDVPMDMMMAAAIVCFACDEVGNPLFAPVDMDSLKSAAVGSWVEVLARECLKALNRGMEEAKK
jgi:hypothetical protein